MSAPPSGGEGGGPPRGWRRLLRRVLPSRDAGHLVMELDRLYARRLEREGPRAARRWYRREVLAFAIRTPGEWTRALGRWTGRAVDGMTGGGRVARGLLRAPGYTAVAVLTLGLGIGVNALILAVVDRALLRPLPFPEPDRLVAVLDGWGASPGTLEILQGGMGSVEVLGGAWDATGMTLGAPDQPLRRVTVARVYPEYLRALRVTPLLGRLFGPDASRPGEGALVLLGADFWEREFGADPGITGRSLELDGERYRIAGVLPRGFDLPSGRNELWIPASVDPSDPGLHWGSGMYSVVARMRRDATPAEVRAELLEVAEEVRLANPLWTPPSGFWDQARVTPLGEARSRAARTPLLILLASVGVVFLVVCANVANLMLARGLSSRRDLAVRAALGAGALRLAGERLGEALLLSLAGLAVGVGGAWAGFGWLRANLPPEIPGAGQLAMDPRLVGVAVVVALLAALLAGILPAIRSAGQAPAGILRQGGRGEVGPSAARRGTTRLLVAAQAAAAVVLVAGAGLLARSLAALNRADPGFRVEGLATARVDLPVGLAADPAARAQYLDGLVAAVGADPSVAGVALASTLPMGTEVENTATFIPGVTPDPNDLPVVGHRRVSAEYFAVTGIPVLAGRPFGAGDRVGSPLVAVVDQTFVRRFFPDGNAVGRSIRYPWRGAPDMEIVGVVGSTVTADPYADREPTVWIPLAQMTLGALDHASLVVVAPGDVDGTLQAVRRAVSGYDDRVALSALLPYRDLVSATFAGTRLLAVLLSLFAGSALLLGGVGVYGVVAFSVRERVRDIGVRMTLGAHPGKIRRQVVREGLVLAAPGALAGLAGAVVAGRALESVLFGVSTLDPVTLLGAPVLLLSAAVLAVYLPARRATRVDPARVLREG